MKNKNEEILLNVMFSGGYLFEQDNIGHEIINFFKADNGKNYIYITPSGKVKRHNVKHVLFIKNVENKKTVEIIAMAENVTAENLEDEIDSIKYAGVKLNEIFINNVYHGDKDISESIVTYKAQNFYFTKKGKRIFITIDKDCKISDCIHINTDKKALAPESMRIYFKEKTEAYNILLNDVIKNKELWEASTSNNLKGFTENYYANSTSFLDIIHKENDEIVFSNLFSYYFQYNHKTFQKFCKNLLKIDDMDYKFEIIRESRQNIDLWIESEKYIIVIENKIKSGINGKVNKDYNQLNKYYDFTMNYIKENKLNKKPYFYIFKPDYNNINLKEYDHDGHYTLIKYSKIYEFFNNNASQFHDEKYFQDFLKALHKQTIPISELNFNTMKLRFAEKIRNIKQ